MTNNIFNKAADKIFFIKINGEVYEMKFENIVLPMGSVPFTNNGKVFLNEKPIVTIRLNIASLGKKLWYKYEYGSELPITKIYTTLEDCINGVNPIFERDNNNNLIFTNITPITATFDEVLMDGAYWEADYRCFFGRERLVMKTYHWNGTEVVSKCVYAPNTEETKGLVFYNSDKVLHYDLVNEKHIVDSEYQKKCYATYEECVNDNFVKVHRF